MKKVNSMQWQIRRDIVKNRVAYFGVFTALALIFSYVETLIPINFGIPGVKLGLANLVIVIALYKMKLTVKFVFFARSKRFFGVCERSTNSINPVLYPHAVRSFCRIESVINAETRSRSIPLSSNIGNAA